MTNRVIVRQGVAAREANKSRDCNPFATVTGDIGQKASAAWLAGWDEADARLNKPRIVLDVWGGEYSETHVARYLPAYEEVWGIASAELTAGYLVNLRQTAAWGDVSVFDNRAGAA